MGNTLLQDALRLDSEATLFINGLHTSWTDPVWQFLSSPIIWFVLCIPMVASILAYYLFVNPTFYYLALILAICLFFVYPSADRCAREMETDKPKE